jgi:hypothetical protein
MFIARSRPLPGAACRVAGCERESIVRRGLCRFHEMRLRRQRTISTLSEAALAVWIANEQPRVGVHQFSLAGLPELVQVELLYTLQQRDQAPRPLDPTELRILLTRLGGAASLREADRRWSASPAGCSTTRRYVGCSATCADTWSGLGSSTTARTRSPATCGSPSLEDAGSA